MKGTLKLLTSEIYHPHVLLYGRTMWEDYGRGRAKCQKSKKL